MKYKVFSLIGVTLIFTAICYAQSGQKVSSNELICQRCLKTTTASQLPAVDYITSFYKVMSTERQYLANQAEQNRQEFWSSVHLFFKLAGYLVGFVVLLLGFLGFNSWKNLKLNLENSIKALFNSQATELIDGEVNAFRSRIKSMEQELSAITSYKRKNIVWITKLESNQDTNSDRTVNDEEIKALRAHGFQEIRVLTPNDHEDNNFEIGTCDLVILTYDKSEKSRMQLSRAVTLIRQNDPPTFIIIYTYNKSGDQIRIDNTEKLILADFMWYMIANFPATVVAHAQLLVRQGNVLRD